MYCKFSFLEGMEEGQCPPTTRYSDIQVPPTVEFGSAYSNIGRLGNFDL